MTHARRGRRLHGARARAGAVAPLRELGDERRRARARRYDRAAGGVAAADLRGRGDRHARVARAGRRVRSRRRAADRDAPTATVGGSTARSATCPSRRPPTACSCWRAPPTRTVAVPRRPEAAGVTLTQQMTISSDTQYRVDFDDVRVGADALVGSVGRRLGHVGRGHARRHHPARRAGRRRRAVRARHHRAVREGPVPVRQAARRVPGDRALPVRRGHHGRRRRDPRVGGGAGRAPRAAT